MSSNRIPASIQEPTSAAIQHYPGAASDPETGPSFSQSAAGTTPTSKWHQQRTRHPTAKGQISTPPAAGQHPNAATTGIQSCIIKEKNNNALPPPHHSSDAVDGCSGWCACNSPNEAGLDSQSIPDLPVPPNPEPPNPELASLVPSISPDDIGYQECPLDVSGSGANCWSFFAEVVGRLFLWIVAVLALSWSTMAGAFVLLKECWHSRIGYLAISSLHGVSMKHEDVVAACCGIISAKGWADESADAGSSHIALPRSGCWDSKVRLRLLDAGLFLLPGVHVALDGSVLLLIMKWLLGYFGALAIYWLPPDDVLLILVKLEVQ
ncbi:hypothetical protein Nepgr_023067 [Nepenthes gracilis]|uniref:Uncharacterized protein n=1 Tax=Nepenthes gracilis TaxID=150966 RepID=A0AAD3XYR4_NEPGR|nr:hypothetical protein Nepgr_023067 [Nepenthes gracilis]